MSSQAGRCPALRLPGAGAPSGRAEFRARPGQAREAAFRRYCDVIAAYAVLEELETEQITVPTFGEIVERLRPLPSFEPSSN